MALAFTAFNCFAQDVATGKHNLASDTLKVMLSNTLPVATNTIKANITEIAAGNGYTAGGVGVSQTSSSLTGNDWKVVCSQPTITASGGSIGPFRYYVLYNDTAANDPLIGWYDLGEAVTLSATGTSQILSSQSAGLIQVNHP